ncbi:HAD family hydrolase [Clostridium sediminicola]|uniref:HAD family hydrolase n=1 Tax=Clostridium sediminicola TaxID=3114879 RepID=UPI0031F1DAF0
MNSKVNKNVNKLENIKTIFFDFDGTVHDSIKIYAPAFRMAYKYLVENKFAEPKIWSEDEISYWLGYSSKEMWKKFMPELVEEDKKACSKIIGSEMLTAINEGRAELYDGAIEVLSYLKSKSYKLIFISNCGKYYMDSVNEYFRLDEYFSEMVCSERFNFIPKYEILNKIKNKYEGNMVIIGDRVQDLEAGIKNSIYTIGCQYGFGLTDELEKADLLINDIKELKNIF